MKAASDFEGYYIQGQGVIYAEYSCPFCDGLVELVRKTATTTMHLRHGEMIREGDVSFCGRCTKCGAEGPKERDSPGAMQHFIKERPSFSGGKAYGVVLPKTIMQNDYRAIEISIPLPSLELAWPPISSDEVRDINKIPVAIYRISGQRIENGYAYDFVGIKT